MSITTHFLDEVPFSWERKESNKLLRALASAYPRRASIELITAYVGIPPEEIDFERPALEIWKSVIELAAASSGRVRALVRQVLQDSSVSAFHTTFERLLEAPVSRERSKIIHLLTRAYPRAPEVEGVLLALQLRTQQLDRKQPMRQIWAAVVEQANDAGRLHDLINYVLNDSSVRTYHRELRKLLVLRGLSRAEVVRIAHEIVSIPVVQHDVKSLEQYARHIQLPLHEIYWNQSFVYIWRDLVDVACRHNQLYELLDIIRDELAFGKPSDGPGDTSLINELLRAFQNALHGGENVHS